MFFLSINRAKWSIDRDASHRWPFIDRWARKIEKRPLLATGKKTFIARYCGRCTQASFFNKKKLEKQLLNYKNYGVHQGLSGLFDHVWLKYSSWSRKTHSLSARACSPSPCTANSTLGLKNSINRIQNLIPIGIGSQNHLKKYIPI